MFQEEKEIIFQSFNIEKFPRVLNVINEYTSIEKLKNIYNIKFENFCIEYINNNTDNQFQKWFKVLYEKDLSSIPIIERKKKNKKKKKKSKSNVDRNKNEDNQSINDSINIKDKNRINNNLKEEEKLQHKDNEIESISAEEKTEDTKSSNGKKVDITFPLEIKSQNVNKNDILLEEDNMQKTEMKNEILIIKEGYKQDNTSENNNISGQNRQNIKEDNNKIDKLLEQFGNNQSTFSNNEKEMFNLLIEINKELKATKKNLSERIDLLEKYQVLLYNQIDLYQNSRDSGKSIFFYLYKYFDLKGKIKLFDQTKEVFNYLDKKDSPTKLNEHQKLSIKKFLRIMYFINQYHNKIIHNQLKSKTKKFIKQIQQKDNSFPVFPEFNYKQFIESIKYFIKNITSNKEIQAVLYDAYENYSIDRELESILDKNKEAISFENDTIIFKIKDEEVEEAIDYLDNLTIGEETLESLCDKTSWDKSK